MKFTKKPVGEKHCKRCGKIITQKRKSYCADCALFNRRAVASIHNGLYYGKFIVVSDPSEYPLEPGLVIAGCEVKCMLTEGTFTENTVIRRGSICFKVVNNTTRSKRFIQRLVAL